MRSPTPRRSTGRTWRSGPGPEEGVDYLYLGDIGDNNAQREEVTVYRVPEPEVSTGSDTPTANEFIDVETLTLRYPDRPHDAETLLVDPVSGDVLIVTKEVVGGPSIVFRTPWAVFPHPTTLEQVGEIDFTPLASNVDVPDDAPPLVRGLPNLPTGGDVSPDGSVVIIRTYGSVWVFERPEGGPLWDIVRGVPCEAPSAIEEQGEAIAFDADGRGYTTISEGTFPPLNHFIVK